MGVFVSVSVLRVVSTLRIQVRLTEEYALPIPFPHRLGDIWRIDIDLTDRKIRHWPRSDRECYISLSSSTQVSCQLLDNDEGVVLELFDIAAPAWLTGGEQKLELTIGKDGEVLNLLSERNLSPAVQRWLDELSKQGS